jgi:hypothetical protein
MITIIQSYIPTISLSGLAGWILLRIVAPQAARWISSRLQKAAAWLLALDDKLPVPVWGHRLWDGLVLAGVGVMEQLATPEMVRQFVRILSGDPSKREERIRSLWEHITKPDFAGIVASELPDDLKQIWNEMKENEVTKSVGAKASLMLPASAQPTESEIRAAIKVAAPAARTLAAEHPVVSTPARPAEIQAMVEALRRKVAGQ